MSIKYSERLAEAGIEPSVGSVGGSYGNAPVSFADITPWDRCAMAETINGLCKAEAIHRRGPWRSLAAVGFATLERVDWFNNRRLLEPIGNVPPAKAEANYYAALDDTPMAAQHSNQHASSKPGAVQCPPDRVHPRPCCTGLPPSHPVASGRPGPPRPS